ncbi:MAG: hypothetical protein IPM23_23910 [Candidatus Melainabacteria bacterium]|nr:hypothetical protein [Candidatus Melainabacteria bacterium]
MRIKPIFNFFYFLGAVAVFAWLLRDHVCVRIVPVTVGALVLGYGGLLLLGLLKPNGFSVGEAALSPFWTRRLRRLAILLPLPAMLYCLAYNACFYYAGQCRFVNKLYKPIARFERRAFSADRMIAFANHVRPHLQSAGVRAEKAGEFGRAESYYKAMLALDCEYARASHGHVRCAEVYRLSVLGSLHESKGDLGRARRLFDRAGTILAAQCDPCFNSGNLAPLGKVFLDLHDLSDEEILSRHPEIAPVLHLRRSSAVDQGGVLLPWRH